MINKLKHFVCILCMPAVIFSCSFLQSCSDETINQLLLEILVEAASGWLVDEEELDDIPDDIVIIDVDSTELKSVVSIEHLFPPIGDQGSYGTCVAWATGYNFKTALNAIDNQWTSAELASTSNQTSPKDLWFAISSSDRGASCNGTNFDPALSALITTGASTLSNVPYSMGSCSGSAVGSSSNKLANYRKIADKDASKGMTIENFQYYLNQGRPIVFGAKLGDRFMAWNSSSIISYDTYLEEGMQHAYHAMVLSGYDNNKRAFRVRNSWGKSWGDNGSIWVDYDFFIKEFVFAAFVGQNVNSVSVSSGSIVSSDINSGYDLMAYSATDGDNPNETDGTERIFTYQVYNSGNKTITASQDWSVVYMYYNAKDANDYGIIYEDYYSDDFYDGGDVIMDIYEDCEALVGGYWNYMDTKSGKMAGEDEFGGNGFIISYTMPANVDGEYYLVVIADAFDKISEVNEDNNFYFITAENGKPLTFENGVLQNTKVANLKSSKLPEKFGDTDNQTTVVKGNENAYTPSEIRGMVLHDKQTGKLQTKVAKYRLKSASMQKAQKIQAK